MKILENLVNKLGYRMNFDDWVVKGNLRNWPEKKQVVRQEIPAYIKNVFQNA